jgi:hypothetical protein
MCDLAPPLPIYEFFSFHLFSETVDYSCRDEGRSVTISLNPLRI